MVALLRVDGLDFRTRSILEVLPLNDQLLTIFENGPYWKARAEPFSDTPIKTES